MKIQAADGTHYQLAFDRGQWVISTLGDPSKGPKWQTWDAERQAEALRAYSAGNGTFRDVSYHNRASHALDWLADRLAGAETARDLAELRAFIEDAHQRIERAAQMVSASAGS